MKKSYVIPTIDLYLVEHTENILEASPTTRYAGGGPTEADGKILPTVIGETELDTDPYSGHGQGTGGAGNRTNSSNLWED